MKLVITIKNWPMETSEKLQERIRTMLWRFWRIDIGRNASDITFKVEED